MNEATRRKILVRNHPGDVFGFRKRQEIGTCRKGYILNIKTEKNQALNR